MGWKRGWGAKARKDDGKGGEREDKNKQRQTLTASTCY